MRSRPAVAKACHHIRGFAGVVEWRLVHSLRSDFSIRCQNDFSVKTWFCEGWHCGFGWGSGDRNRHSGKKENEQIVEHAKALPRVRVHKGGHLLETEDGEPFWLEKMGSSVPLRLEYVHSAEAILATLKLRISNVCRRSCEKRPRLDLM